VLLARVGAEDGEMRATVARIGLVDRLLGRGVAAAHLVAGGSVLLAQDRLRGAFLAALDARHPEVGVQLLDQPPVLGALALASREG